MKDKEIIEFWDAIARTQYKSKESGVGVGGVYLSEGWADTTYHLIKRLKREHKIYKNKAKVLTEKLEALGDPLQDAQYKIAEQQAEIERLKKSLDNMTDALVKTDEACGKAETEVIKEFAERVKAISKTDDEGIVLCTVGVLDNLVKEMVGDVE